MQAVFITLNNVYPLVSSLSKALRRSSASFFFAKRSWKTVPGWALTVILELFVFHQHNIVNMESVGASNRCSPEHLAPLMFFVYLKVVRIFKPGCAPALLELDDNFGTSNWTKLISNFFGARMPAGICNKAGGEETWQIFQQIFEP